MHFNSLQKQVSPNRSAHKILANSQYAFSHINLRPILFSSSSPCEKNLIAVLIGIEIKMYGFIWRKLTFLHYWVFILSKWDISPLIHVIFCPSTVLYFFKSCMCLTFFSLWSLLSFCSHCYCEWILFSNIRSHWLLPVCGKLLLALYFYIVTILNTWMNLHKFSWGFHDTMTLSKKTFVSLLWLSQIILIDSPLGNWFKVSHLFIINPDYWLFCLVELASTSRIGFKPRWWHQWSTIGNRHLPEGFTEKR